MCVHHANRMQWHDCERRRCRCCLFRLLGFLVRVRSGSTTVRLLVVLLPDPRKSIQMMMMMVRKMLVLLLLALLVSTGHARVLLGRVRSLLTGLKDLLLMSVFFRTSGHGSFMMLVALVIVAIVPSSLL